MANRALALFFKFLIATCLFTLYVIVFYRDTDTKPEVLNATPLKIHDGYWYFPLRDILACRSESDLKRIAKLIDQGDTPAANTYYQMQAKYQFCLTLTPNDDFFVNLAGSSTGLAQGHPRGNPEEYWVVEDYLFANTQHVR